MIIVLLILPILYTTVPPAPTVTVVASSNLTYVGESFNLVCSALVVPNGLISDLILMWSGPGVDQNSAQLSREASDLSLSFSPLYTSHGGVYVCTARLTIPEAGVDVMATQEITVYTQSKQNPTIAHLQSTNIIAFFQFPLQL